MSHSFDCRVVILGRWRSQPSVPTEQAHPGHAVELVEHVRMAVVHANLYEREKSEWAMFVIHRL